MDTQQLAQAPMPQATAEQPTENVTQITKSEKGSKPVKSAPVSVEDQKNYTQDDFKTLLPQIQAEYDYSFTSMLPKMQKNLKRLKLYNNQRRDDDAVGDHLLFTVHQTILASLYDDRLTVDFTTGYGDEDVANNLHNLAENDSIEMEKDIFDYEWDWDATFFGRALAFMTHWDTETNTPIPELIDPTIWMRDPDAWSVNGNRLGIGAMRFGGREILRTMPEMEDNDSFFDIDKLTLDSVTSGSGAPGATGTNPKSLFDEAKRQRKDAMGIEQQSSSDKDLGANNQHRLVQWLTYWKDPKLNKYTKCIVELNQSLSLVVRYTIVKTKKWPLIDRTIYPIAHSWDGVSVPDLIEDKQRMRAVIQNLVVKEAKYRFFPSYIYDQDIITNKADLENVDFNRFIPGKGNIDRAIRPIQKTPFEANAISYVMEFLDQGAQRATATPELQQGVISKDQRTLGELNIVAAKVDTRYSLSAKIFGWSERRFWIRWYDMYKEHFTLAQKKSMRIEGALGTQLREITKENIILNGEKDPDVTINSFILQEAKRMKELAEFKDYTALLLMDPSANKRFALRKLGRLHGFKKEVVDLLLPRVTDEWQAEKENESLNKNILQRVMASDNDMIHLEIHGKAADTPAAYAHIETHKEKMRLKKENPNAFPKPSPEEQAAQQGNPEQANLLLSGRRSAQAVSPQQPLQR
jgi:hypothetical protein